MQRYLSFVHCTFRLYPAQTFLKLFSLSFGAKNPFCCKDATSVPKCVGQERGLPWGPRQSVCITATPVCSKKIVCGRPGCCCASFVLTDWNENLGEQEENSSPWCGLFTWNTVLFKFVVNDLLFVIRIAVTDLSSLLFLHMKWALFTDLP